MLFKEIMGCGIGGSGEVSFEIDFDKLTFKSKDYPNLMSVVLQHFEGGEFADLERVPFVKIRRFLLSELLRLNGPAALALCSRVMFTPYSEILAVFTSFNESEDYDKVEVEKIGKYDSFVAWLNVQAMAAEAPESIAGLVLHSLYVVVLAASNWEGLKRNVLQLRGELETDLHETYVRWRRDMLQQWALKPSFAIKASTV